MAAAFSASESLALLSIAVSLADRVESRADLAWSLPTSATDEIAWLPSVTFASTSACVVADSIAFFASSAACLAAALAAAFSASESLSLPAIAFSLIA